jgi:toxin-antitoxin system PIN domain toxin
VSAFLLDVNVLVALLWPAHASHALAQGWFANNSKRGWATCPFTQAGFVRIVSNPAFSSNAVAPSEAARILTGNLRHRFHQFWPDAIDYPRALGIIGRSLSGHRQVTDAYLLALALHKRGKLATLDRATLSLLRENGAERRGIELIDSA